MAYKKAQSSHKWVYTHRTGKWDAYYSDDVLQMSKAFMDCFLKGETSNGFLDKPQVRLEVRSSREEIHAVRFEEEWPLARTIYTKLHLSELLKKMFPAIMGFSNYTLAVNTMLIC